MNEFVTLKDGTQIPRLGMGTWFLGEHAHTKKQEMEAIQAGQLRSGLMRNAVLKRIAEKYQISVMQLQLLFVLRNDSVIAIPRSSKKEHVLENWEARKIQIEEKDWKVIDREFPMPTRKMPLDIV